jgi:endo-1,4-beta-xylanase
MSWAALLAVLALPGAIESADTLKQAAALAGMDFGTCLEPRHLEDAGLRDILLAEYSVIEAENAMKFGPIHPRPGMEEASYDFSGADALAAFAGRHKLKFRGHTLVWHNQNAAWVTDGTRSEAELLQVLDDHIARVVGRYRGRIYAWDVVNEAFLDDGSLRPSVWYDKPGIGLAGKGFAYLEHAFRQARKADPKAKLYYNDYGAETLGPKADAIYAMAKDFRERGVPLDGIGFQAHLILPMNKPEVLDSIEKNFARFAKLGLEIEITELDIRLPDGSPASLAEQADFYRKFVALCRRQPQVKLIQTWGISDRHSWIPRAFRGMGWALLWDEQYRKKPAYNAVMEALQAKR